MLGSLSQVRLSRLYISALHNAVPDLKPPTTYTIPSTVDADGERRPSVKLARASQTEMFGLKRKTDAQASASCSPHARPPPQMYNCSERNVAAAHAVGCGKDAHLSQIDFPSSYRSTVCNGFACMDNSRVPPHMYRTPR